MKNQTRRRPPYKPGPIAEEALLQLSQKFHYSVDTLRKMAEELRLGRPKLEMHLICLQAENRKKTRYQ